MKRFNLKSFLLTLLILAGLVWAVLGEEGLLQLYKTSNGRDSLLIYNEALKAENESLRSEIKRLKGDDEYLGKVARKELGLVGKNEVVYRFDE